MAAILVKVFTLALRTVARPLSHQFQQWAMQHPTFRQTAINTAQVMHHMEVYISRGAAGKESKAFVGTMSDKKALEMAAKVISEGFVFSVGVGILTWEYLRSRRVELKKKDQEEKKMQMLHAEAELERQRLQKVNDDQNETLRQITTRLDVLEEKFTEALSNPRRR